jgi:hypothetical protein
LFSVQKSRILASSGSWSSLMQTSLIAHLERNRRKLLSREEVAICRSGLALGAGEAVRGYLDGEKELSDCRKHFCPGSGTPNP